MATIHEKRLYEFCLSGYVYHLGDFRPDREAIRQLSVWAEQAMAHPSFPQFWLFEKNEYFAVRPYQEAGKEVFHMQWLRKPSEWWSFSPRVEAKLLEVALSLPKFHVEEYVDERGDKFWRIVYR
jgi:hypothetical protein